MQRCTALLLSSLLCFSLLAGCGQKGPLVLADTAHKTSVAKKKTAPPTSPAPPTEPAPPSDSEP